MAPVASLRLALSAALLLVVDAMRELPLDLDAEIAPDAASVLEADAKIWGGKDVHVTQLADGLTAGPFPSFVSLVLKRKKTSSAQAEWFRCGGSLYRGKFILTAAHCATYDPAEWDMHAYLNPFMNPMAVEEWLKDESHEEVAKLLGPGVAETGDSPGAEPCKAEPRGGMPDSKEQAVSEFRQCQRQGLGRWLDVAPAKTGAEHFGVVHPKYENIPGVQHYDLAVVPLASAPFEKDSKAWEFFNAKLGSVEVGKAVATAYGNGATAPWDSKCGLGRSGYPCHLQQKSFDVLSLDACIRKVLPYVWLVALKPTASHSDDDLRAMFAAAPHLKGKDVDAEVKKFRELADRLNATVASLSSGSISKEQSKHLAEEVEEIEEFDAETLQTLQKTAEELELNVPAMREGRQLCVMSTQRSGNALKGDSGSPLVGKDGSIVGVASWALSAEGRYVGPDMQAHFVPSFYASTAAFQPWIDSVIDKHEQ